jgi:hypothetical protein
MILHFKKELNVIMYIIEKTFKLNFNHFIWTKSQYDLNYQNLCLMFKMKYLISIMQCNTLS